MGQSAKEGVTKSDGTLKKKYSDMPRYKTIFGYEASFTDNFESLSKKMVKDIAKEIVSLAKVGKKS